MPSTDLEVAPQKTIAKTYTTTGYAAHSATTPLKHFTFERREPRPKDVQIDILYCGVCHSDLHTARNEWTNTTYPVVPGHEIVGRVAKIGRDVRKFKVGDHVELAAWSILAACARAIKRDWKTTAKTVGFSLTTAKTNSSAA
jgi:D-arabinose 1-dehydrogenase-like Zn-dependent alcohol dehydrogenase